MNAAVALAAVRQLAKEIPVSDEIILAGLSRVHWAGRLQVVTRSSGQKILLDGAHNVSGAEVLAASLREYFPGAKPALVFGILRDKDWSAMCEILAPLANRILLVPVHSERTAEPHGLAEVCARANPGAQVSEYASLQDALLHTANEEFVLIAGSLYLIGEAMELLHLSASKAANERDLNEWTADARTS
jgi:dihydrofolate synthase/folylpolyglutamate synthase